MNMKKPTTSVEVRGSRKRLGLFVHRREAQKGFTLLLAALVASVVLSIGAAIFTIAMKQVTLSEIGRDSQFAFYTADTAAECALFWDLRSDIKTLQHYNLSFATSSDSVTFGTSLPSVTCNNDPTQVTVTSASSSGAISTFFYAPSDGTSDRCAQVTVAKYKVTSGIKTVIHADGYSTTIVPTSPTSWKTSCNPSNGSYAITADQNALQRSVELRY